MLILVCRTKVSITVFFEERLRRNMVNIILKQFGEKVRAERLKQGISQEELAAKAGVHRTYIGMIERAEKNITLLNIAKISRALGLSISNLTQEYGTADKVNYIFNEANVVRVQGKSESLVIDIEIFENALKLANNRMYALEEIAPDLFEILGMRNLSAFVGEMFVRTLEQSANGLLVKNPHQDGYPDLLIMTREGKSLWENLAENNQDKKPFSGFEMGGIEVKATVGSVPTPAQLRKKGLRKPEIGDERIELVTKYDWKAHHRETSNLIGIYWDFVKGKPIICGLFFGSNLVQEDWGNIVKPKEGGGRTTSVSIMKRSGIHKMYENWIAVIDDPRYHDFFNRYNRANLIDDR